MVRGSEGVKRIVPALVMALLAALILSGCRASTAPETPSAARRLSCAQPSSLAGLCPAGGAKVAMCRTDESGAIKAAELEYDLRFLDIAAFDAAGSRMLAHFYLSPYSSRCGSAIFDPVTGEFYLLCAERYQAVFSDEDIKSGFGTSGCTYERGAWQNIALDICLAYELDGIVCHELWHATENHILSCDYSLFTVEGWAQLNPQGFSYYEGYDYSDPDSRRWTYYSGGDEGVYFADGYSRTFASEDRARIMEFFMTRDDDAQELIKSPAIKKKLQHMSSAVRSVFDTSGWESVRWERLL